MSKAREAFVQEVQNFAAGVNKLASLAREQQAKLPTPAQAAETAKLRDRVTQKMASIGMIPAIEAPAFRASLDDHGGVEHLLDQLLDRQAEKTASTPESGLGSVASAPATKPGIPVVGYVNGQGANGQRQQPLYHR